MTQNKLIVFTLFFLLQIFAQVQAATFIMWAEGQGATLQDAKASAVTALSQQVISKVESSFRTELSVKNENVDRDSKSIKQIQSNLILKGVQYVDEVKDGTDIRITAGLDKAAIRSTIDYMKEQLDVDYAILDRDKKLETLVISDQLTAFVSVLPNSVLQDLNGIEAWNKNKRDLLLKHIYMGRVVFVSNTPSYSLTVDEKPITSGSFFNDGSYEFTASAEGYRTMSGNFSVSAGETVKVNLPFIKAVSNKSITLKLPDGYDYLQESTEETLSDLGINVANNANNSLIIKIKDSKSQVDEYESHELKVRIEAYKQQKRIKKVTLRKNLIIESGQSRKVKETVNLLVRKGTVALMSKIDLEAYFQ